MISSSKGKISEFFSVCLYLMKEAGTIISEVYESKNLEKVMKDIDDPMTVADLKSQCVIEKGLRHFWPKISIIGEETVEYKGKIDINFSKINPDLLPGDLYMYDRNNKLINNEFDIEDVLVWVDPLDGTLSYVNNELDAVCTLIGVSYKKRPLMGLVCQHYERKKNDENEFIFRPKVFFSHSSFNSIHYVYPFETNFYQKENIIPFDYKYKRIVQNPKFLLCTSKSRFKEKTKSRIQELDADYRQVGGSGRKLLEVIEGLSDCYFYDQPGTKKWDTCSGEALLLSLGGILTGLNGLEYQYEPEEINFLNKEGIVAMIDRKKHKEVIEITKLY